MRRDSFWGPKTDPKIAQKSIQRGSDSGSCFGPRFGQFFVGNLVVLGRAKNALVLCWQ